MALSLVSFGWNPIETRKISFRSWLIHYGYQQQKEIITKEEIKENKS
jgi:hypothetical protein